MKKKDVRTQPPSTGSERSINGLALTLCLGLTRLLSETLSYLTTTEEASLRFSERERLKRIVARLVRTVRDAENSLSPVRTADRDDNAYIIESA